MRLSKQNGFSLVELMIVVGIIGILSSMVTSKFWNFTIKARRSEARMNLSTLHDLEQVYQTERGAYANPKGIYLLDTTINIPDWITVFDNVNCNVQNVLGYAINNCAKARYVYSVFTQTNNEFLAEAFEIMDADHRRVSICSLILAASVGPPPQMLVAFDYDGLSIDQNKNMVVTNDSTLQILDNPFCFL